MSDWRPEGWKNPYMGKVGGDLGNVYQAGADAMLEAIKQTGEHYSQVDAPYKTIAVLNHIKQSGWLVFIPDGE